MSRWRISLHQPNDPKTMGREMLCAARSVERKNYQRSDGKEEPDSESYRLTKYRSVFGSKADIRPHDTRRNRRKDSRRSSDN